MDEVLRLGLLIVEDALLSKVESLAREFLDCQLLRGSEIGALLASWKSQPPKGGLRRFFLVRRRSFRTIHPPMRTRRTSGW